MIIIDLLITQVSTQFLYSVKNDIFDNLLWRMNWKKIFFNSIKQLSYPTKANNKNNTKYRKFVEFEFEIG